MIIMQPAHRRISITEPSINLERRHILHILVCLNQINDREY